MPNRSITIKTYLFQVDDIDDIDDIDLEDDDRITPEDSVRRWRAYAPHLEVVPIAGNHATMLEMPHVEFVAALAKRIWFDN